MSISVNGPIGMPNSVSAASISAAVAAPSCKHQVASFGKSADSVFSVERVVYPLINEAVLALQEHVASVNDIDMAMIAGTGMSYHGDRKGPLGIADIIGLDVVLSGLEQLFAQYGERFRPARLLRTKVRAGHLGVKSGRGFHEYA